MRAMTEIEWLDGRVTKVPELALGDALGESVQAELDFGFDDVLEGLWVEVRHHEPDEDSDGDPRGRGCALYADCRYSLVEPSDLDRVFCILYEGQPRVQPRRGGAREPFAGLRVVLPHARISLPARRPRGPGRVAGELVNLSRACALSCLMLGSPYPPGALEALAACARYLCGPAFTSDLAARVRARISSGLTRLNIDLSPNDDPHPIGLHDDASMSQLAQSFRYSRLSRTDFFSSLS